MPLAALILQGIPEEVALVTLAFVITKSSIKWRIVILSGVSIAFINYLIRNYFDPFGIHTIVTIVMLFAVLLIFGECGITTSIFASLLSMAFLIILEMICVTTVTSVLNIPTKELTSDTTIRILVTLPQVFVMSFLGFLIAKCLKCKKGFIYADKS